MTKRMPKAYTLIPTGDDARRVLHQRAADLAKIQDQHEDNRLAVPYVKFRLGKNELYGVEFASTKGVIRVANLKRPPCVPSTITGLINYQGKLIGVIDMENLLNIKSGKRDDGVMGNVIVVYTGHMTVGLLVNEIEMIDDYVEGLLSDSILSEADIQNGFIKGVDKGRVSILNIEKILASIKVVEGGVS